MKLKINQLGNPILRQRARALSVHEIHSDPIQQLIKLMIDTMHDTPGVGLAAPQIGESLQLIVIEDRPEYTKDVPIEQLKLRKRSPVPLHVVINPKLYIEEVDQAEFFEGCLSIAGFVALVPRTLAVRVECLNEKGEPVVIKAEGWYARILQHEIDHLQGTLCIDRMRDHSLMTVDNYMRYWKDKPVEEIMRERG